jgi:internalin A
MAKEHQTTSEYLKTKLRDGYKPKDVTLFGFLDPSECKDMSAFLEYPNLERISFSFIGEPTLEDITPLAKLEKLQNISLEKVKLKDFSQLNEIKTLKYLSVSYLPPELEKLKLELEGLTIKTKSVDSLEFLKGFPTLKSLGIGNQGSKVASIEGIENLTNLSELRLENSKISDLSLLSGLKKLEGLYLATCKEIRDISALESNKNLRILDLNFTSVEDLSPLSGHKKLENLLLRKTKVKTLTPLSGCTSLRVLYVEKTKIKSLEGIENLVGLEVLAFWDTKVKDLTPLTNLSHLTNLDLTENEVRAGVLENKTRLKTLDLFRSKVDPEADLSNLISVWKIRLAESDIVDFSFLGEMKSLRMLDVSRTNFSNDAIKHIEKLPQLKYVNIWESQIDQTRPDILDLHKSLQERAADGVSRSKGGVYDPGFYKDNWNSDIFLIA